MIKKCFSLILLFFVLVFSIYSADDPMQQKDYFNQLYGDHNKSFYKGISSFSSVDSANINLKYFLSIKDSSINQDKSSMEDSKQKASKFFVGINLAHTLVVGGISLSIGEDVSYIPIRLNTHIALSDTFGISGIIMYRYEQDGGNFQTHEIGFAVGPRYSFNKTGIDGFYATCKIGMGFCSGVEYSSRDYYRFDLILNPEIGYVFPSTGKGMVFSVGLGLQTLLPIAEDASGNSWDWNDLGNLSHYFLPVINVSIGFKK